MLKMKKDTIITMDNYQYKFTLSLIIGSYRIIDYYKSNSISTLELNIEQRQKGKRKWQTYTFPSEQVKDNKNATIQAYQKHFPDIFDIINALKSELIKELTKDINNINEFNIV